MAVSMIRHTPARSTNSLELCYKSSMFEIKRLNKLWSDQSLYCKPEVLIPIFDDDCVPNLSLNEKTDRIRNPSHNANRAENELNEETIDQLFQRIDLDVKQTKRTVKRLAKKRGQTLKEIVED
uniref:LysM domain-containing protein n=1 Tax=Globodera rostochiensis TaxID=31243 RepID=A0A914HEH4_GLORO